MLLGPSLSELRRPALERGSELMPREPSLGSRTNDLPIRSSSASSPSTTLWRSAALTRWCDARTESPKPTTTATAALDAALIIDHHDDELHGS
jgi:hypothetical protein